MPRYGNDSNSNKNILAILKEDQHNECAPTPGICIYTLVGTNFTSMLASGELSVHTKDDWVLAKPRIWEMMKLVKFNIILVKENETTNVGTHLVGKLSSELVQEM